jgi:hypothetical protein
MKYESGELNPNSKLILHTRFSESRNKPINNYKNSSSNVVICRNTTTGQLLVIVVSLLGDLMITIHTNQSGCTRSVVGPA